MKQKKNTHPYAFVLPSFSKETSLPVPIPHLPNFCRILIREETQVKILLGLVAWILHK
jgi:hypothetical protein